MEDERLVLTLSIRRPKPEPEPEPQPPRPPSPKNLPPPNHVPNHVPRPIRNRANPRQAPRGLKPIEIPAPFDWATTRRASIHSLQYLLSAGIKRISGEVQCKRCEGRYVIEYDLKTSFMEIGSFIRANHGLMHDRAPKHWLSPTPLDCRICRQSQCVKPIIALKKQKINWLFLFLGHMLGCCTLEQLKYFCKHTKNHRTGAKDRVLYLTYLGLCKQLDHTGL
ncbi:uncharacterized protein LOC143885834 [Tasmannia lanceolata]|uniref:uncharacterized protein LOC143885834 n=1 Tax=Tasmannia lanceolata TaxID=3420 RepID=UPI00406408B2